MKKRSFSAVLDTVLLSLLLLAMCSQLDLATLGRDTLATEGYATKRLAIALPDIALLLCFGWFCVRTSMLRAWHRVWLPPFACWALVFSLILSAVHSPIVMTALADSGAHGPAGWLKALIKTKESKEAIAETIQWTLYFLVAPLVFVNWLRDVRDETETSRLKPAAHAFGGAVLLNVALALIQRFAQGSEAPVGAFGSPNAYGAFLVLALPVLLSQAISTWRGGPALPFAFACFAGGLLTVTSVWAAAAMLIGAMLAGAMQKQRPRATVLLLASLPFLLLWDAPSPLREARVHSARTASATQPVKKQLVEWQAAAGAAVPRNQTFATGVGAGNYQFNIGSYYKRLPNEEKMPPDSNNLYLVQFVAIGALGLCALGWVAGHFFAAAWRSLSIENWLASGAAASLIAFGLVNIFHAAIVRGTGVVLAFVFALAVLSQYGLAEKIEPAPQQNA